MLVLRRHREGLGRARGGRQPADVTECIFSEGNLIMSTNILSHFRCVHGPRSHRWCHRHVRGRHVGAVDLRLERGAHGVAACRCLRRVDRRRREARWRSGGGGVHGGGGDHALRFSGASKLIFQRGGIGLKQPPARRANQLSVCAPTASPTTAIPGLPRADQGSVCASTASPTPTLHKR